jgi:hypothetical protein
MKRLKGQIGLEYLAIYGIALILLVIVIALVLGIFSNTTASSPICMGEPALFQCKDNSFQITKNSSGNNLVVNLRLLNGAPKQIQLKNATCYAGRQVPSRTPGSLTLSGTVASQGYRDILNVPCYDSSGNAITYTKGLQFDGTVEIHYIYSDDIATDRVMYLRIRGVAE